MAFSILIRTSQIYLNFVKHISLHDNTMVIFLKKKRKTSSSPSQHIVLNSKGRLYVSGVYAGFEDDSFKLIYHPNVRRREIFVPRKVSTNVGVLIFGNTNPTCKYRFKLSHIDSSRCYQNTISTKSFFFVLFSSLLTSHLLINISMLLSHCIISSSVLYQDQRRLSQI